MGTMRMRVCARCGDPFSHMKRDRNIWCPGCAEATKGDELFALVFDDRSGIHGMYETPDQARLAMKVDAEAVGMSRLLMVKVVGQAGARQQLRDEDPNEFIWDRRERADATASFEADTA